MALLFLSLLNGVSYGLLLFMLSAGLTLIFSMMGVLNFAHASFYMLGAYLGYTVAHCAGFGTALWLAPVVVGLLGAGFEHGVLRRVRAQGHVPELLATFGGAYVLLEAVQLIWGRTAVPFSLPSWLQGSALTWVQAAGQPGVFWWGGAPAEVCEGLGVVCTAFPASRLFMMAVAVLMLLLMWLLLRRTRLGWVIQAALTQADMVQALGHNVPRIFTGCFAVGCALAGLAGVVGGSTFVTEPAMAAAVGSVVFVVVVVGGVGSLKGALVASLLIGCLQTWAVAWDRPLVIQGHPVSVSQLAPLLPYALMVLVLTWRPQGLFGQRVGSW